MIRFEKTPKSTPAAGVLIFALTLFASVSHARDINVKYRNSPVDVGNGYFLELDLRPSSLVNEMFYDSGNKYLLVSLKGTFYHYCNIPGSVVTEWISSPSLGRYYISRVMDNFDCRLNPLPEY